jgi:hypothetical protein
MVGAYSEGMRTGPRKTVPVAAALAVVLLAGCSGTVAHGPRPAGQELQRALAAWSGFPVQASPRPLVLAGPDIISPPGFPSGATKLAYLEGKVTIPARFLSSSAAASGFQPVTARQAAAMLRSAAATGPPTGTTLRVTMVRLGTGVFLTDRGPRRLPAWQFRFAGIRGPAAVLAVAPAEIFTPPIWLTQPPFVGWAYLGAAGRVLTVRFVGSAAGRGPCTSAYSVQADWSATAVAVAVQEHPHGSADVACASVGYPRQVTIRLPTPLGARVLVDAVSRIAVPVTTGNPAH